MSEAVSKFRFWHSLSLYKQAPWCIGAKSNAHHETIDCFAPTATKILYHNTV